MSENYLNNLIYTEYLHDVQILEDVTDVIPEYVPKKDKEITESSDNLKESTDVKQIKKISNAKKEKVTRKKEVIAAVKPEYDLLEFNYTREIYSTEKKTLKKPETHPFKDWLNILKKEKLSRTGINDEKKVQKKNKGSNYLIDEFIETNPKIAAVKENKNNKDFSVGSVEEKTELFTETLAKIYIKQKAYEKAISAYKKLSLKYPEKSTYFADQVKNIKKTSNNK